MFSKYAKNTDGLAAILGHEMAHFLLGHCNLQYSISQFFSAIGQFAGYVMGLPASPLNSAQGFPFTPPHAHYKELDGMMLPICGIYHTNYSGL